MEYERKNFFELQKFKLALIDKKGSFLGDFYKGLKCCLSRGVLVISRVPKETTPTQSTVLLHKITTTQVKRR